MKGLPLAPPPSELVEIAETVAASAGLQVDFTSVIEGQLVWCVKIRTDRGDVTGIPKGNTERVWIHRACVDRVSPRARATGQGLRRPRWRSTERTDATTRGRMRKRLCGRTATMSIGERNDPAHPGKHCDGQCGARHPLTLMVGPQGKSYA